MTRFELKKLTAQCIENIKTEWADALADEDVFELEFSQMFEFFNSQILSKNPDGPTFYALQEKISSKTYAILDVIHGTKDGSMLTKLLKIVVSPALWRQADDSEDMSEVFAESMIHTILMGAQTAIEKSRNDFTVKIYGRNEALFDILLSTYKILESKKSAGLKILMQGRWLCVSRPKELNDG